MISIGMVAEDGRQYYAVSNEFDSTKASAWVRDHVLSQLPPQECRKPRSAIANEILQFAGFEVPEFWAYYAAYDWVAMCQLYGTMTQLPVHWPRYCRDLKQWCDTIGKVDLPKQETLEHHALNDALWTKMAWESIRVRSSG